MTVKVSPMGPVKKILEQADPTEDTWVMIRPITFREDMLRGEILKQRPITEDPVTGQQTSHGLNMYALRAEELWLTYHSCHIVLEDKEGDKIEPIGKPADEITRNEFMEGLTALPSYIVIEWYNLMLEVNPDWRYPF